MSGRSTLDTVAGADLDPVPWGLGFARRFVPTARFGHLSPRELHALRLAAGMILASLPLSSAVAAVQLALGRYYAAGLLMSGTLFGGLLMAFTLRDTRRLPLTLAVALVVNQVSVVGVTVWQGGVIASGCHPIWGLIAPISGMLLAGRRAAVVWGAIFTVTTGALLAWSPIGPLSRGTAYVTSANLLLFGVFVFVTLQWFVEQREIAESLVELERERADNLLRDMLPPSVVEQLKRGKDVARSFDAVSVLFADLVGFTPMCAELPPGEVVQVLDQLFREFDEIVARHGLEKIKTIGDCYMVASGVPEPRADHCQAMALLAIELRDHMATRSFRGRTLGVRIGVATGPAVAGVIGAHRFVYDVWGDTVNVASRMESSGARGRIQVTEAVKEALGAGFRLESRGDTDIEGKGMMRTYWLEEASLA